MQLVSGDQKANNKDFVSKWAKNLPPGIGFLVQDFLPPFVVLIINQILLVIIQLIVKLEANYRFSEFQISLLEKVFVYFLFNMLIVPGFAVAAASNLYQLVSKGFNNASALFNSMFAVGSGDFFVNLVIQSAGITFMMQFTSLVDLVFNYFSPVITLNKRVLLSAKDKWKKSDDTIFPYGLSYAQEVVFICIGVVFR